MARSLAASGVPAGLGRPGRSTRFGGVPRLPRVPLAAAILLAALCVLVSGGPGARAATVKVPLPSRPMSKADSREVAKVVAETWKKIHGSGSSPGLWVGIWDRGRGSWERAYGNATRGGPPARTGDHLRIGSITKTFTATVVLELVAEGKLSLQGTVGGVDPDLAAEFPPLARVTIAQLLAMRSGIPDYLNVPDGTIKDIFETPNRLWSPAELIAEALGEKTEKPGTPGYSTTNYIVLQLIAEAVTGDGLESLIAERIARPLGLRDTALPAPTDARLPGAGSSGYVGEVGAREFRAFGAKAAKPGPTSRAGRPPGCREAAACTRPSTTSGSGPPPASATRCCRGASRHAGSRPGRPRSATTASASNGAATSTATPARRSARKPTPSTTRRRGSPS